MQGCRHARADRGDPVTLLVISPDYASHLYPLATLATAWRDEGERVVVATGPATDDVVRGFGYEREHLQLGRGSNPGVIRAEEQPPGEDDSLRGFFAATREGAVAALTFQARARGVDLLWNAVEVAREVHQLVERVRPDAVLVDHLAFGARLGLVSAKVPHADVVLGHPSALTVGDEVYGYPPAWPHCIHPDPHALADLRALCVDVRDTFTAQWNAALAELDPAARPSRDAFAETGDLLLLNYPGSLHEPERTELLPAHTFLGSAVRREPRDPEVEKWLAGGGPVVYVSLGSFLSARSDLLAVVAEALRGLHVRVALATGSAPTELLGPLPPEWLVRAFLPQVRLLAHCAVAVSHGGNNSVTEALTAGVPLLVLPLSTDQFAGAAAVEGGRVGVCLDPNAATPAGIRMAVLDLLSPGRIRDAAAELGAALQEVPGAQRAHAAVSATWPAPAPGKTGRLRE
jgi:zeaxanthin glucosyltransferase